jgi:hypothetical protein
MKSNLAEPASTTGSGMYGKFFTAHSLFGQRLPGRKVYRFLSGSFSIFL